MLEWLPAFDAAISAAGYNSVHELLFAGIPSVFVPFERVLDDQERRATFLEEQGAARAVSSLDVAALSVALREAMGARATIAASARRLVSGNGAAAAANVLLEVCR
jgi:UDP-N-acetylglucosamine:LPS N-acetylglucosamine transferase